MCVGTRYEYQSRGVHKVYPRTHVNRPRIRSVPLAAANCVSHPLRIGPAIGGRRFLARGRVFREGRRRKRETEVDLALGFSQVRIFLMSISVKVVLYPHIPATPRIPGALHLVPVPPNFPTHGSRPI